MVVTLAPVIPLPCEQAEPAALVMADCGCITSTDDLTTLPCGEDMCPEHATDHQRHAGCRYCLSFAPEWEDQRC
jgi:hypothetical protein